MERRSRRRYSDTMRLSTDIRESSRQLWVPLSKVTRADLIAILGICLEAIPAADTSVIGGETFLETMARTIVSEHGVVEENLTPQTIFEVRRLPTPEGYYARFRVRNRQYGFYGGIQDKIDEHFEARKIAQPLSAIS